MNIDAVGYRYSGEELEALRLILDLPIPPGMEPIQLDKHTYRSVYDSLCEAGLLMDAGNQVFIDPLTMLLMQQLCASPRCLRIRSGTRHTMLYRAPEMFLVNDYTPAGHTLTPLQNFQDAYDFLFASLEQRNLPIIIEQIPEHTLQPAEAYNLEGALSILESSLTAFNIQAY